MVARPLAVAVLAGGAGRRMRSRLPKTLLPVAGRPAILHVLDTASQLAPAATVVVHGPDSEALRAVVRGHLPEASLALQPEPRGTGDAAQVALQTLGAFDGDVLILCGDVPLLSAHTLDRLRAGRNGSDRPALAVLGFRPADPTGYGRLQLHADGSVQAIIEERDADPDIRASNLCNAGVLVANAPVLAKCLGEVGTNNAARERMLTDAVAIANVHGHQVAWTEGPAAELMGVNTRSELAACEAAIQDRLRAQVMDAGASLVDPATTWLAWDTQLGPDVRVEPQVFFGPGVRVGQGTEILAFSHLEGAVVGCGCRVGPFARLRPGSRLEDGARVGNFVEVKNAVIGPGAKVNHLAYVGDGTVGAGANIGAGTIFCNYDGTRKHRTEVGPGAFIGSNTALVAPVRVGRDAVVGAGSTITRDVPDATLAVERTSTRVKPVARQQRPPRQSS